MMTPTNGNIFRVRRIHRLSVDPLHKGKWRGALMCSFIGAWTIGWANNGDTGELRCHHTHYDVTIILASGEEKSHEDSACFSDQGGPQPLIQYEFQLAATTIVLEGACMRSLVWILFGKEHSVQKRELESMIKRWISKKVKSNGRHGRMIGCDAKSHDLMTCENTHTMLRWQSDYW